MWGRRESYEMKGKRGKEGREMRSNWDELKKKKRGIEMFGNEWEENKLMESVWREEYIERKPFVVKKKKEKW